MEPCVTPNVGLQRLRSQRPSVSPRLLEKRGQLFTVDAVFAFIIVLSLFGMMVSVSTVLDRKTSEASESVGLGEAVANAVNQLVEASGKPADWSLFENVTSENVNLIGLAYEKNVLDEDKVKRFFNLTNSTASYAELKKMLGLTLPGYNFFASVLHANGTVLYSSPTRAPALKHSSVIERIVLMSGQEAKIRFGVWID